jgi:hypothetical protein
MGFIPTRVHAVTDYFVGSALIVIPPAVNQTGGWAVALPVIIGILLLIQNLATDYEYTAADLIPVRGHLAMDSIAGGLLAVSPWLFGFFEFVLWPHVIVGMAIWLAAMATETHRRDRRHPLEGEPTEDPRSPRRMAT